MCKFEIGYYYENGGSKHRTGVVYAESLGEAVAEIERIDDEYSAVAWVRFKQIPRWKNNVNGGDRT